MPQLFADLYRLRDERDRDLTEAFVRCEATLPPPYSRHQ